MNKRTSKVELLARRVILNYFPNEKVIFNYRPDFLQNSLTGRNLEIDIYLPNLSIGVEVQSDYHKKTYQRFKDTLKDHLCESQGIKLFDVYYEGLDNLHKRIYDYLKIYTYIKTPPKLKRDIQRYIKRVKRITGKLPPKRANIKKRNVKMLYALALQTQETESNRRRMLAKLNHK